MVYFLCDYNYEPEYMAEEVEAPFFVLFLFVSGSSASIAVCLPLSYNISCLHFVLYATTPSWE